MAERSLPSIGRPFFGVLVAMLAVVGALLAPLSAQAAPSVTVSDAIARILSDTNALRTAGGLAPLTESTAIDAVAQNWSARMFAAGSLTHNPSYSTQIPSGWTGAAENIATGYSYSTVVEAWHQSAGHYANIIGNYNAIGIGYYESNGTTYFTEDFGKYSTVPSAKLTVPSGPPTPIVSGHSIVDSRTGGALTVHAVNWPSFEYACQQGWGNSAAGATAAAANAMVAWGINAVRLPVNQDCWLGVDGAPAAPITAASYQAALSSWVATLNAAGLIVILDLHWTAPSGSAADGQRAMPDAQSTTFWTSVASLFTASKSVMFETFNEPYSRGSSTVSWSCWLNGGCQVPVANDQNPIGTTTYTAVGQAALVAAIRATGATQPILLDGLNYANDLTGWLANKPNDTQLIASWHNYPGQGCSDTTCWNSQILPVAASVPVITTEFGMTDNNPAFFNTFMSWADSHGIGYAPWAWWVTGSSDGAAANLYSLISNLTTFAPRAPEGTAYFSHLGQLTPHNSAAMSFVLASYTDVLGRTPATSDGGVQYWCAQISAGASRTVIAASFNGSDEYRLLKIGQAYQDVLGRAPDPGGQNYWLNAMRAGAVQPDDAHRTFLTVDEFYDYQGGGTDTGYVSALYRDIIGRDPDAGGLAYWVSVLRGSGRVAVVNGLWYATETFNVRVREAFQTFLGRAPSASETDAWAGIARSVGLTGMRTYLMTTDEYWNRAVSRFP